MDLWIVAAATGAGYVAKHWKQLSKETDDSIESFSDDDWTHRKFTNLMQQVLHHHGEMQMIFDSFHGGAIHENEHHLDFHNIYDDRRGELGDMSGWNLPSKDSSFYMFNRNRHHRMMSHVDTLQPLSPLESCFNEYSAIRPLLVTDGSRGIDDLIDFETESWEVAIRRCQNYANSSSTRPSISRARPPRGLINSQGPASGMLLFLGITMGMISRIVTYKKEVDRLNEVVEQTRSLVQDLHEELEMKDRMNVEEISGEETTSRFISTNESCPRNGESAMSFADDWDQKKSDNMKEIEAELETELERLELNFQTNNNADKISDFVELDSDLEVDVIQGDVKLEGLDAQTGAFSDSDEVADTVDNHDIPSPNNAVSPRELALRLHQVIQEQLEARIHELETALQNTHKKLG